MLIHRRRPPNAGLWNGIGGKLQPGEDPFAACVREVREETGFAIDAPVLRALLVVSVKSTGDLWTIFVFTATAPAGEPVGSDEGELAWVEIDQLPALPVPADLPVILPRVLEHDDIIVARLEYETEGAAAAARAEILGPS